MKKYVCEPCGYEYDPAVGDPKAGIAPGTAFEDLPEDWFCPICMRDKSAFEAEEEVKEVTIKPQRSDIYLEAFAIVWLPYYLVRVEDSLREIPAFER